MRRELQDEVGLQEREFDLKAVTEAHTHSRQLIDPVPACEARETE